MKAAVVGAGVAGLTAALALRRVGLEVAVHDPGGASDSDIALSLPPNATRILRALGLGEPLAARSERIEVVHVRGAKSGHVVAWQLRGAPFESRYGAPYLEVTKRALIALLQDAATARGVDVRGSTATHREDIDADLVIHAARQGVFGASSPVAEATPWRIYRGTCPAEAALDDATLGQASIWPGVVSYFDCVRVESTLYWRAIVPTARALDAALAGWAAPVAAAIAASGSITSSDVYDHRPLGSWHDDGYVLIGSACHPLLPHPRFDAALAIEDGWVLAHMLDLYEDEAAGAAGDFERHRKPRAERVQNWARRFAMTCHPGRRSLLWRRNLALAAGCRFLPEMAMQRDDWLYGYDAVRHYG